MKKDNLGDVSEELYEHFKIEADKGQDPLRVDKFIINRIENTSRNRIQLAAKNGFIFVNNKPVKSNYKVKPFDEVKIMLAFPKRELELTGENIALDVIYEDDHILIINKPYDMVVHPGHGNYSGTMLNGLIYHFEKQKINDIHPGLVHRIDKNTTGLLVVAKRDESLMFLTKQFYDRTVDRSYLALVEKAKIVIRDGKRSVLFFRNLICHAKSPYLIVARSPINKLNKLSGRDTPASTCSRAKPRRVEGSTHSLSAG